MNKPDFGVQPPDLSKLPPGIPKEMLAIITFALLGKLAAKYRPWIERELESDWNITGPRLLVIGMLSRFGSMRMGELSSALELTPRAITRLVDGLTEDGYVAREKDLEDGRVYYVMLTPKAQALAEKYLPLHDKRIAGLFSDFSSKELKLFIKLANRITQNLS